jgi:hypothetical protein
MRLLWDFLSVVRHRSAVSRETGIEMRT